MRLLLVNPNSTASMTEKAAAAARGVAAPGTEIVATNPSDTPASIEGHADEAACVPSLLACVRSGVAEGADAVVLACFDDPGLYACREVTDRPVVGSCEAAMLSASMVAGRFAVVSTLPRAVPIIEDLVQRYGMDGKCRHVRAADVPVLSLEEPGSPARERVRAQVQAAVRDDGAEAVILGCAGMADLAAELTAEVGVPVIDGVAAGVKLAEALVGLGLRTSKLRTFQWPRDKADTSVPHTPADRSAAE
jgi:allantoin racemase